MNVLNQLILEGVMLKNVEVAYNDCEIDPNLPFEAQEWSFKEDIVQINFDAGKDSYTVDIGWYPEFELIPKLTKDFIVA